jgi:hypothetical protein
MKHTRLFTWLFLIATVITPLAASQSVGQSVCSDLVTEALAATTLVCEGAGRNSACYGHPELSARPQFGVETFDFDSVGDVVSVSEVNSLRLSALDLESERWGVALLKLQANIPDENPENLSLLLFGDVQVRNLIETPVLLSGTLNSDGNANVRREPNNRGFVVSTLPEGSQLILRGRSLDDNWIYIDLPGSNNQHGWIARDLIRSDDDLSQLRLVRPGLTQYGPMQAFYLRTGAGTQQSTCAEASNDGVLIQTPEGVAEIRLWINEVKIRLGSTAFIQAQSGESMVVKALEGAARVEALGVEQVAVEGESITIPLNENLLPAAPPAPAEPYEASDVKSLPVDVLDRPITLEPSPTLTITASPEPTATATLEPSATPEPTTSPEPTATASLTPLPTDTNTPEPPPTDTLEPTRPPNTWTPLPPTETDTEAPPVPTPTLPADQTNGIPNAGNGDSSPTPESTP